jgi:hypothetical protein
MPRWPSQGNGTGAETAQSVPRARASKALAKHYEHRAERNYAMALENDAGR